MFSATVSRYGGSTVFRIDWRWVGEDGDAVRLEQYENLKERTREVRELTAASAASTTIAAVLAEQVKLERATL